MYVRKLREKLERDPAAPELLVTVWGIGYRFDPLKCDELAARGDLVCALAGDLDLGPDGRASRRRSRRLGDRPRRAEQPTALTGSRCRTGPCPPTAKLSPVWLAAAVARLQRLGVPAHLESTQGNHAARPPSVPSHKSATSTNKEQAAPRQRTHVTRDLATPNFKPANAPTATNANRYQQINIHDRELVANLLIPRGNPAVPWLAALASGLAALLAAIIAASVAVRRWMARPLVQLASSAEQIAAGYLEIDRVLSPVREITVVGEAQYGMAHSLAEAVRAARAADHERHFLITAIAHDLRTPLFTLRGSLEALELGIGGQEALPRAKQKAAHLDRLVSDLFTFSRLEYAPEPHHRRPFDLRETAQHAVDSIATAAADARIIAVELPDEPVILHSDETAVARIFTNLLDNAIRHARQSVHLRVQQVHDRVELEVSDDGPGFPAHTLPHIFDPFYQADSARSTNGGAGLGLTIVHRLATRARRRRNCHKPPQQRRTRRRDPTHHRTDTHALSRYRQRSGRQLANDRGQGGDEGLSDPLLI